MMPSWVPVWGGKPFTFFQPIFNIADACISVGVISILLFQHKFFNKHQASTGEGKKAKAVDEMQAIQ